ncbi:uncharacterized protein LOC111299915 isoform X1 [Durio zibethinus]|uniref:Uncharacterized protein LOC111299915 isoform X1 n=1 Tax=Durio zibethinus TaxID=66656 RepID=A0A6P5ZEB3_DURZI|nr:uncharacterized protein LOC111299915 isoform X1 [Durio zibethinus]
MNRLDVESWQSRPHLPRSILRERTGWMGVFGEVARRSNFPELSCFCLLETQLPRPPDEEKNNHLIECGISYAQYLSIDHSMFILGITRAVQSQLQSKSIAQRIRNLISSNQRSQA